jgi:hypothetical protein
MSDNNKNNSNPPKFGTDGTNVRRASRARNRTVLLTPEATEEMRSQLSGLGSQSTKPVQSGFGGGFGSPPTNAGSLPPKSGAQSGAPATGGTAHQGFFRPSQSSARQPDFGSRKTEQINPAEILGGNPDDRLDFNDSASSAGARPTFEAPVFDSAPQSVPVEQVSASRPTPIQPSAPVAPEVPAPQATFAAPRQDSNLDEINRRLRSLSAGPAPEPAPAVEPPFARPVAPVPPTSPAAIPAERVIPPVSPSTVFGGTVPVTPSPAPVAPAPAQSESFFAKSLPQEIEAPASITQALAQPVELEQPEPVEPEEIDSFAADFADFEPAGWDEPAVVAAVELSVPVTHDPVGQVSQGLSGMQEEVLPLEDEFVEEAVQETQIIEEQEDMAPVHSSNEDIVWQKATPLVGFLISLNEENYGRYYELHAGRLVITSEPVAGGSYLLLKNETVSPMHAVLRIAMNGSLQILDQLSENGTKILRYDNGQELELSGDKAALNHGDVIQLGDCVFSVCLISLRDQEG